MLKALLWDVDGTLAETERDGHLPAFNGAFAAEGVPWRWTEARYAELLRVAGGRERLRHDLARQPAAPRDAASREALVDRLHRRKNALYAERVGGGRLPLRAGVAELLEECRVAPTPMGIVTTTSGDNVAALLRPHLGARWRERFAVVIAAEEAPRKKPFPDAYHAALAVLGLDAADALAIEDSPAGVRAARAAGIAVVRVRSVFFPDALPEGELASGPSLAEAAAWRPAAAPGETRVTLAQLAHWHGRAVRA